MSESAVRTDNSQEKFSNMTKLAVEQTRSDLSSGHEYTKKFARQMLKNTIFIGTYQEKRFVEGLNAYRDVINISKEEVKFIKNLLAVKKKILDTSLKTPWIGITEPDTIGATASYSLWVELSEEIFGEYWFNIKTAEFLENEVRLKVEIVRSMNRESSPCRNILEISDIKNDLNIIIRGLPQVCIEKLIYFHKCILNFENIKVTVIFVSLLLSTLVAAGINVIKYLLEYLLKFIREVSGLIKVLAPIVLNFFHLINRIVFGLYHMIVLLIQGKPKPQNVYNLYYNSEFDDPRQRYNQHFVQYPTQSSGVRILPLDN